MKTYSVIYELISGTHIILHVIILNIVKSTSFYFFHFSFLLLCTTVMVDKHKRTIFILHSESTTSISSEFMFPDLKYPDPGY